jgi:outer membrane protein assembly factor BamD
MKANYIHILISIILAIALSGCKTKKDDDTIVPPEQLYSAGLDKLSRHKYSEAAKDFGKIFFQHPGNDLTPQAELMQAYSLYLSNQYDEAIDILDVFIKLHPMNVDIAYAYYLKAICHYMEISNVQLDQSRTELAKESFEEVIGRFPGTKYAIDASLKMDLVNDHLAGKDMDIARYYLNKNNPVAAINRFQNVIQQYQTTSYAEEALYRLVESYVMLGVREEAVKYASVLGHNYPEGKWYKHAYRLLGEKQPKASE